MYTTTDLHDLEFPLDFIVISICRKFLLERAHFRLQLFLFPYFSLRTFFVESCDLGLCNG